jgi:hypothetical protein
MARKAVEIMRAAAGGSVTGAIRSDQDHQNARWSA